MGKWDYLAEDWLKGLRDIRSTIRRTCSSLPYFWASATTAAWWELASAEISSWIWRLSLKDDLLGMVKVQCDYLNSLVHNH